MGYIRQSSGATLLLLALLALAPAGAAAQTVPEPFTLSEPVPNPALCCAAEMTLVANDERVREVTIELLDARGAVVRLLYRGQLARGDAARRIAVEPEGLPSGTYFVRLRSESFELVRRVVMVK